AAAGRVDEAIEVAERLEQAEPAHRMAALMLTAEMFRVGDFEAARARVEADPGAYHPLVGAMLGGWAAFGLDDEAAAAASFDGLEDRPIFRIFSGYHKGLMLHAAGDPAAAAEAFRTAAGEVTTPTGRIARAYAAALGASGDIEGARGILEGALEAAVGEANVERDIAGLDQTPPAPAEPLVKTPADGAAEALYGLAAALGRDGEDRLSLFYTRVATHLRPGFDDAALLTAELLSAQDQQRLAIKAYEAIPPSSPLSRSGEIGRAEALHELEEDARAVEALRNLTRREPEALEAHVALGDLLRRTERFDEAAEAYDAAVKLMEAADRPNWVLYYQRGIAYERSDQWPKAEADFFRALELRDDQPLVLNYLGYSWLEMGVNLDRALDMIRKAVSQRPDDGYIVDSLGWAHYLLNDFPAAVRELERAVELRPIDPVINDHLGDALWRVGRKREAEFQWRRALSFDPEKDEVKRIRRKIAVGLDVVLAEEATSEDGESKTADDG
ncbi:MAG: tetratricopeptide repeat protein, partial [Pseudomonadota bacterium]